MKEGKHMPDKIFFGGPEDVIQNIATLFGQIGQELVKLSYLLAQITEVDESRSIMLQKIDELKLSTRAYSLLRGVLKITTIGDLLTNWSRESLLRIPSVGPKCLKNIEECLAAKHLKLRDQ